MAPSPGWYLVAGEGHLFLKPGPHAVCGLVDSGDTLPEPARDDAWCPTCDTHLRDVYLPQIS